jgi:antitoxin HicB
MSLSLKTTRKNPRIGSDFEDYLRDEGQLEESTSLAMKRVVAWEFSEAMRQSAISQSEMARRMGTSRAVVHRLLDRTDPSVTLLTMTRAATALGRTMQFELAA